ncbi:hypothetical protein BGX38DRAFT_431940 [Terfezia claveryi]|nr:hypothetical protein BGX38DRAFT_431940 [Terfezia claveryi]
MIPYFFFPFYFRVFLRSFTMVYFIPVFYLMPFFCIEFHARYLIFGLACGAFIGRHLYHFWALHIGYRSHTRVKGLGLYMLL